MKTSLRLCAATLSLVPGMALAGPANDGAPVQAGKDTARSVAQEYPTEAVGDGVTTGGYNQSRWAEDWTRYRDPAKRDDPIDRLKYIPIGGDDVYLTLSGEFRYRINHTTNPNLRDTEAQRQDINRIVAGADLHLGKHIRVFGELAHAGLSGVNLGTKNANLHNALVVQQSFVDVMGEVGGVDVGVRYGRQTFTDGSNLLLAARDNNAIFYAYNGTRAWARGKTVRADFFDLRPTRLGNEGISDDLIDRTTRFSGVSTGIVLPTSLFGGSKLYFDPFIWRLRDNEATWGRTTGREVRNYLGAHFWGNAGPANIDWTVSHQGGEFNGRDVDAWQIMMAQTWRVGSDKNAPRVGLHFDYATGGGAYDNGKLRNAVAPSGNNIYYSYQLYATPTNLIAVSPSVQFRPLQKLRVDAEYQLSWRQTASDAVYRANGSAFAGTQNVEDRKIADTIRLQAVYAFSPRVSFTGRYEHLIAGPSLTKAGYHSSDFFAGWLSFRF